MCLRLNAIRTRTATEGVVVRDYGVVPKLRPKPERSERSP